ncbi:hypothetical protein IEQ34_005609 [Dendrobium chrysotoxum]|uniref:Uncharacterized protein n=1 Tax=Dendrobium chrysotoxum TaxID=161865 RepID=A0AAV7H9E3_DENCH|nr:hypothetical protein IEQ34_005609 [Dendrobium chrysotoxum]
MSSCSFPKRVSILETVAKLLSCLLDGVKVVEKNILHTAKKLAEKVLVNFSLKLKPYLAKLFNGNGALLMKIRKLAINYQSDFFLTTHLQGYAQEEGENFHPEKSILVADGSSKMVTNNESFQNGNGDFMATKQKVEIHHHSGKFRVNTKYSLDSGITKPDKRSNLNSRNRGINASLQLSISNDHGVGNMKKAWSNYDKKLPSNGGRNGSQRKVKVRFSKNKQIVGTKKQKGVKHAEAEDKELKLKEVLSSQKSTVKDLVKDQNLVKDTDKTKSRSVPRVYKRLLDHESIGPNINLNYGQLLSEVASPKPNQINLHLSIV